MSMRRANNIQLHWTLAAADSSVTGTPRLEIDWTIEGIRLSLDIKAICSYRGSNFIIHVDAFNSAVIILTSYCTPTHFPAMIFKLKRYFYFLKQCLCFKLQVLYVSLSIYSQMIELNVCSTQWIFPYSIHFIDKIFDRKALFLNYTTF
jgi:hypothetical protein